MNGSANRWKLRHGGRRGSALSLVILASVIITAIVLMMATSAGTEAQFAGLRVNADQSFYAAEGGMQWVLYKMRQDPTWRPAGISPLVNGWTCTVTYTDMGTTAGILGNPLKVKVVAQKAGAVSTGTACATVQGVLAYAPQFYSGGNLAIAQSAHIDGDVQTMGTITINAPSSGGVIFQGAKGVWKAAGGLIDHNPSGTGTYFATAPQGSQTLSTPALTAAALIAAVKAGPTVSLTNCLTIDPVTGNYVIDFTKAGGKPMVYSGPASYIGTVGVKSSSNPSNDTLLIDGPATFTGTYPFNATTAPMHLLVNGDVSFNGSGSQGISITGSMYVSGNWNQQGIYSFKGAVICDKTTTLSGTGTVNTATPPTFDPRYVPRITAWYGNLP